VVKDPYAVHREMQAIVRLAAEPRPAADSLVAALLRASRALGISYRRTVSFWYGYTERVRVSPEEAAKLRAERDRLLRLRLARLEQELAELRLLLNEAERRNATARKLDHLADGASGARAAEAAP
jgi:hypothetical protein